MGSLRLLRTLMEDRVAGATTRRSVDTTVEISVNGQALATGAANLDELLRELDYSDAKVATAVNDDFVPATNRGSTKLLAGDRVEIVSARQGG